MMAFMVYISCMVYHTTVCYMYLHHEFTTNLLLYLNTSYNQKIAFQQNVALIPISKGEFNILCEGWKYIYNEKDLFCKGWQYFILPPR